MNQGPRIIRPDRQQLRWDMVDLDSQLPEDHRARVVWAYVEGLDLRPLYDAVKARDEIAGRPASDPAVLLALWLYATVEGIGAARVLARLCEHHAAYRWLCGGVPVNRDMLTTFRRENGAVLDRLLTQSLTALIAEGLLSLEEAAIDGTKVRARAGRGSLSGAARLQRLEEQVGRRVAELKAELEADPGGPERRRRERGLRAAEERTARIRRAQQHYAQAVRETAARAKTHRNEEAEKSEPRVCVSDPQARSMRLADGSTAPAWNVQVGTAGGFVVTVNPTDRRNDSGLATDTVADITSRCGRVPRRLLADTGAMTADDLINLAWRYPALAVYSPPPPQREDVAAATRRKRAWKRRREPPPVQEWRARMAGTEGQETYRRRKLTERAHGHFKNHGMHRFLVHGRKAVRAVCLLHALALNLMWAHTLRRRRADAQPLPA